MNEPTLYYFKKLEKELFFEDILLKLFIQGKLSFWIPSNDMKDFSSDVINITSKFELEDNIKYNNYSVEFKQILSTLSDLLDQKCFDTGYTQINVKESILNYDEYTIKI